MNGLFLVFLSSERMSWDSPEGLRAVDSQGWSLRKVVSRPVRASETLVQTWWTLRNKVLGSDMASSEF